MPADDIDITSLKDEADRALRGGDPRSARELFRRALTAASRRFDLWMGLAASERATGDINGALAAIEGALAVEPRSFHALLMKGSLLEANDQPVEAALIYGAAIGLAPSPDTLPEPSRRVLARAKDVHMSYVDALTERLRAEAGLSGGSGSTAIGRRAEAFIDRLTGRRRAFHQEPTDFHYPGMPSIEFYERDEFPFLAALEAETAAIREELLDVWAPGSPGLTPYVKYPAGVPLDQFAGLNHSLDWSAYHLWLDGAPMDAHLAECPRTAAAIQLIDQPHVQGRSPAAMFSILRPRTRIPAHTGVANTRLVLHLPLVVPEGCGFRVGGETRPWREGVAWVFDDTIEHEAWNDSDLPRAILICDVWSPRLAAEERELVTRLMTAIDRFNGFSGGSGAL